MKIYHNPRCRKSRETLAIIEASGLEPEVIRYLDTPPDKEELAALVSMLGIKASELVRKGEQAYKDHYKGKSLTEEEWLEALARHPKLIERPIVVSGGRAVIGRPPENVKQLL
jgi:arsenate reductase